MEIIRKRRELKRLPKSVKLGERIREYKYAGAVMRELFPIEGSEQVVTISHDDINGRDFYIVFANIVSYETWEREMHVTHYQRRANLRKWAKNLKVG